jgi:hypothetical protein
MKGDAGNVTGPISVARSTFSDSNRLLSVENPVVTSINSWKARYAQGITGLSVQENGQQMRS